MIQQQRFMRTPLAVHSPVVSTMVQDPLLDPMITQEIGFGGAYVSGLGMPIRTPVISASPYSPYLTQMLYDENDEIVNF